MARISRIVIPNIPHHIVQRGNRNQRVFFNNQAKEYYLRLLHKYALESGLTIWAYCLMDNHIHLIVVPQKQSSLAEGIGKTHKYYTRMINFRENWRGYLWQGRFSSFPLDEQHLFTAVRYVERNPVRAGIVKKAEEYPYSSAKAHVLKVKDKLLSNSFMVKDIQDWSDYLSEEDKKEDKALFIKHTKIGRPLGDVQFIKRLEKLSGRILRKQKPGPKKR